MTGCLTDTLCGLGVALCRVQVLQMDMNLSSAPQEEALYSFSCHKPIRVSSFNLGLVGFGSRPKL